VRSRRSGRAKDKVQTMISTDIMISAAVTRLPVPGAYNSASLRIEHPRAYMGAYSQVVLPLESVLGSVFGSVLESILGAYLGASVTLARSVPSCAIRSVLGSMLGSVLENALGGVLGSVLGVYSGAYSECTWEHLESVLGSV